MNESLSTMWHDAQMTPGIDPIAAPVGAQNHEQRQHERTSAQFGAAMSHREAVQAKLRVDPAAVTERMSAPPPKRRSDHKVDIEV